MIAHFLKKVKAIVVDDEKAPANNMKIYSVKEKLEGYLGSNEFPPNTMNEVNRSRIEVLLDSINKLKLEEGQMRLEQVNGVNGVDRLTKRKEIRKKILEIANECSKKHKEITMNTEFQMEMRNMKIGLISLQSLLAHNSDGSAESHKEKITSFVQLKERIISKLKEISGIFDWRLAKWKWPKTSKKTSKRPIF